MKTETKEREMQMTIDWTKPIETIDGDPVFYVGKDKNGKAVIEFKHADGIYRVKYETGQADYKPMSVRNVPEKPKIETKWINLYAPITDCGYDSKEKADKSAATYRSGLIEITYKDEKPIDVKLHPVDE
jgi:hypothetical protein